MKWEELLKIVEKQPVFTSTILLSGSVSVRGIRRQLSRWVKAGKIISLRRGLYALAPPYLKSDPHPFLAANAMKPASYVSLQSALAYYGLIPEHTPVVTSVTTGRPERVETTLGMFTFSHIKKTWFTGYHLMEVVPGQSVFIARPEKSLLDLVYLTPSADSVDYLQELRLQNLDQLDARSLMDLASASGRPKLSRAAKRIVKLKAEEDYREI